MMLHHSAHATHSAATGHGGVFLGFGDFGDHAFGREEEARDRGRVLKREARDFGGVENARFEHVDVFVLRRVVAVGALGVLDFRDHQRRFATSAVLANLAQGGGQAVVDNLHSDRFVALGFLDGFAQRLATTDECHATAGDHAFFHRRTGRVQGVVDAILLLLHLDFGRRADVDHRHAARQLRQAFLELLAVVVGGGLVDLLLDLADAPLDVGGLARAFHDGGGFLLDGDALRLAEVGERDVLELDAEILAEHLAAREDGDVFEHGLAAVAEARRLDGADVERAAELVHHEGREGFAFDVLRDDEQGLARLRDVLEQGQHVLKRGDLLLVDQDVAVFEDGFHGVGVGDEVGAEVALIELHPFDDIERGLDGLRFLDGDRAVLADLLHRVRDGLADGEVAVRRDGRDLRDLGVLLDLLRLLRDAVHDQRRGLLDAALERHRVGARRHVAQTFAIDRLRQERGGGGAVARGVGRLARDFANHLRAHVLVRVGEFDFLGDGHAVLGNRGSAELLVEDDVAAAGAERGLDGLRELLNAREHGLAGFVFILQLLC